MRKQLLISCYILCYTNPAASFYRLCVLFNKLNQAYTLKEVERQILCVCHLMYSFMGSGIACRTRDLIVFITRLLTLYVWISIRPGIYFQLLTSSCELRVFLSFFTGGYNGLHTLSYISLQAFKQQLFSWDCSNKNCHRRRRSRLCVFRVHSIFPDIVFLMCSFITLVWTLRYKHMRLVS